MYFCIFRFENSVYKNKMTWTSAHMTCFHPSIKVHIVSVNKQQPLVWSSITYQSKVCTWNKTNLCCANFLNFPFSAYKGDVIKGLNGSFTFCLHLIILENDLSLDILPYHFLYTAAYSKHGPKICIPSLCRFIFTTSNSTWQDISQTSTNLHHHWCKHLFGSSLLVQGLDWFF